MRARLRPGALAVTGVAAAGVLLGHWLAYAAAVPGGHSRAQLLAATGHGYLTQVSKIALVLLVSGVGALFLKSFRTSGAAPPRPLQIGWRLALIQTFGFVAMEAFERIAVGISPAEMLQ